MKRINYAVSLLIFAFSHTYAQAQDISGGWELYVGSAGRLEFDSHSNPGPISGTARIGGEIVDLAGEIRGDDVQLKAFALGEWETDFTGSITGSKTMTGTYVIAQTGVSGDWSAARAAEQLSYVSLEPCRLVDTRLDRVGGAWAGEVRSFKVSPESTDLSNYGGNPQGCGVPDRAASIQVNLTAISPQKPGYLRAWAWPQDEPTATLFAWNSGFGATNATPISMCKQADCEASINVKIFSEEPVHLVIDVLGYHTGSE